jgi:hypothetical protein
LKVRDLAGALTEDPGEIVAMDEYLSPIVYLFVPPAYLRRQLGIQHKNVNIRTQ